jgi:hypothetical protein
LTLIENSENVKSQNPSFFLNLSFFLFELV